MTDHDAPSRNAYGSVDSTLLFINLVRRPILLLWGLATFGVLLVFAATAVNVTATVASDQILDGQSLSCPDHPISKEENPAWALYCQSASGTD